MIIIEYLEEMWPHNPLLPTDPYERAVARFWIKFAEDKVHVCMLPLFPLALLFSSVASSFSVIYLILLNFYYFHNILIKVQKLSI
jgi:glutathione S-transferase